jgi:hypothetical protein
MTKATACSLVAYASAFAAGATFWYGTLASKPKFYYLAVAFFLFAAKFRFLASAHLKGKIQ